MNTADLSQVPPGYDPSKHTIKGPTVIDGVGMYKTRCGHLVEIFEIKDNGASFNCHGYLYKHHRATNKIKKEWSIWHPSGAFTAVQQHHEDIVEKALSEADATIQLALAKAPAGNPNVVIVKGRRTGLTYQLNQTFNQTQLDDNDE